MTFWQAMFDVCLEKRLPDLSPSAMIIICNATKKNRKVEKKGSRSETAPKSNKPFHTNQIHFHHLDLNFFKSKNLI